MVIGPGGKGYRVIGDQAQSLHDAMLSGLNVSDLQQLTCHELNERPGTIPPDGALSTVVFKLIQWAERQGRAGSSGLETRSFPRNGSRSSALAPRQDGRVLPPR
jgi:hypothetical protein